MIIYEKPDEYTTIGHIDPLEFQLAILKLYDNTVNLGDVKQVWECQRYINRITSFVRCSKYDHGARAITVVKIGG